MKTITRKEQSGQSLVELAISLMVILMLLLGAVEISMALFQYVTLRDAAQEGAIYGSIEPEDESGIKYRTVAAASDVVQIDPDANVDITLNGDHCEGIDPVTSAPNSMTVTITFDHPIIFPIVGPMIGTDTIRLTASVTNTILRPICAPP